MRDSTMVTMIEVLDDEGALMGFFRTRLPLEQCKGKIPFDFEGVEGDWWPSGGFTHLRPSGKKAWYRFAMRLGEMREVPENE